MALLMYAGAPLIADMIGNRHVVPSIRAASWALLFVPVMTGLRGYFQGLQQMVPTAVSQVVEQTIRVTVMIVLLLWLMRRDASLETIAAGAMMGSVAGGMVGLLVMLGYMVRHRRKDREVVTGQLNSEWSSKGGEAGTDRHEHSPITSHKKTVSAINPVLGERSRSNGEWIRTLLMYAIPVCLGSLAVPLMNLVDTFTVPRLLREKDWMSSSRWFPSASTTVDCRWFNW